MKTVLYMAGVCALLLTLSQTQAADACDNGCRVQCAHAGYCDCCPSQLRPAEPQENASERKPDVTITGRTYNRDDFFERPDWIHSERPCADCVADFVE